MSDAGPEALVAAASAASTATTASSTRSPTSTTRTAWSRTTTRSRSTSYPDGYYLTDDLTDQAHRDDPPSARRPTRPSRSSCYFAHGAVHAPLHAKADDIARYRGRYDAGWDAIREAAPRAPARRSGCSRRARALPPRNAEEGDDVAPVGRASPPTTSALFARYMEVYAAMVDSVDQNVGRLLDGLDELGELDNTIFVFTVRQRRLARGRGRRARRPTSARSCRRTSPTSRTSTPTSRAST